MQLSIYDVTVTRHQGNKFSRAANKSLKADKNRLRELVLKCITDADIYGATSDEVEVVTGLNHQTVSARFTELKALDLIKPAGQRKTRSGRNAGVWVSL